MRKWIIDLSSWQVLAPEQWATMVANGLSGVIIRSSQSDAFVDSRLDEHIGHAKFHNLPYGLYQWIDPTRSPSAQADVFLALVDKYQPTFAAADFEQYWASWEEWYNKIVLHKDVPLSVVPAEAIFSNARAYINYLVTRLTIPFVGYSAAWYINGYCPRLSGLLNKYPFWNAGYVTWNKASMTFAEFAAFTADLAPAQQGFLPVGGTRWEVWQISDRLPLPDLPALDIDLARDDAVFAQLFGGQNVPPYHPDEHTAPAFKQYRVGARAGLRVRSSPAMADNYLYSLKYGTVVVVYEVQNGWARIKPDQQEWCSLQWLEEVTV